MTFNLPENKTYHFAVYLYSGWDSTEAKVSEAKIEILWSCILFYKQISLKLFCWC